VIVIYGAYTRNNTATNWGNFNYFTYVHLSVTSETINTLKYIGFHIYLSKRPFLLYTFRRILCRVGETIVVGTRLIPKGIFTKKCRTSLPQDMTLHEAVTVLQAWINLLKK
jgi:hypothetical protein